MTRPPLNVLRRRTGPAAFSLVELLVVIGIVAILMGLAVPAILRARKSSDKATTGLTLQVLTTAITAYHQDHGIYPPMATGTDGKPIDGTGFSVLGRCLLGVGGRNPGGINGTFAVGTEYEMGSHVQVGAQTYLAIRKPPVGTTTSDTAYWTLFSGADGVDGPGFKLRRVDNGNGVVPDAEDTVSGKTYGPYVDTKFPAIGFALRDGNDNAILYYPATGRKPDLATGPYVGTDGTAFYNANHNSNQVLPLESMRRLLGDKNFDGAIGTGETAAHTGPYLLWSAGSDGVYGFIGTATKSDDVTNFNPPGEFVK